jgi:hypothetical protein
MTDAFLAAPASGTAAAIGIDAGEDSIRPMIGRPAAPVQ